MKIALIGNCQLSAAGQVLTTYFANFAKEHSVVYSGSLYDLGGKHTAIVPFYKSLSEADVIYGHYHAERWDVLSTNRISEYFDVRLVPNLYSPTSYLQLNHFTEGGHHHLQLMNTDFRMLEMYINGVPCDKAEELYHQAAFNLEKINASEANTYLRYKEFFESGKLIFDYSPEYRRALLEEHSPYFTYNHPNNSQLQWLINQILTDIKCTTLLHLKGWDPILYDSEVPKIGSGFSDRYRIRSTEVGLNLACKIFYTFFGTYDRDFLIKEYEKSDYINHR